MSNDRPSWDQYFLQMARNVASRATCIRRKVGAVATRNNRVVSTGYNGTPMGISHCTERGCLRDQLKVPSGEAAELCRGLHAEQNLVIQGSLDGCTVYCTNQPCVICAKMLINSKVVRIVYSDSYPDKLAEALLKEAKIPLERIPLES